METTATTRSGIRWLPALFAFAAFVALGVLLAYAVSQARGGGGPKLEPAHDFTVPLYTGGPGSFTMSEHRGHTVLLNFWASWCAPCRAEFPVLQAAADKYKDQNLVVVGVAINDSEDEARLFLEQQNTTFLAGHDLTGQVALAYTITGLPATFFITPDGRIYKKWLGQIDETRLTTFIEELLKS
ncbi:MAG: TlpA family protein disulfide reductase [Dehalococcoidia bacterium]|nr:TlpA family protein disulfide reductase [Dehalococcoidia bacterium]